MFTVVRTTTSLSLDEHFIKHPAATFFVKVEGDGMHEHGIYANDTLVIDRSINPTAKSLVIAVIEGELTARPYSSITEESAEVWGVICGSIRDFR